MKNPMTIFASKSLLVACLLTTLCGITLAESKPVFFKALWCHKGGFVIKNNYKADSVLNSYKKLGINLLFYGVGALPYSDWNFLDSLIKDCHEHNIQLHPYIMPGQRSGVKSTITDNHPEWLVRNMKGELSRNLNLAHPEARRFILESAAQFLEHDIDGLHLDYIRFDLHQSFSYDDLTCEMFKDEYGTSPLDLDKDTGDPLWCVWLDWNANKVTSLVSEFKSMIDRSGRKIPLSAAVFPDPSASRYEVGQDWEQMVKKGLLDIVSPMVYVDNSEVFRKDIANAMRICRGKASVIVGIWLGPRYHRDVDVAGMVDHIKIAIDEKASGISFWSASSFTKEYQEAFVRVFSK